MVHLTRKQNLSKPGGSGIVTIAGDQELERPGIWAGLIRGRMQTYGSTAEGTQHPAPWRRERREDARAIVGCVASEQL